MTKIASQPEDSKGPGTVRYRDRIYAHYAEVEYRDSVEQDRALAHRAPHLRELIRLHFPEDRSAPIIDLGCGDGSLILFAREAGYQNVVGVDASPQQVARAQQLGIHGVVQGALMEVLRELPNGGHALVVTIDVLEHLTKEETVDLVDEVHRVLSPGGRWIIHTANGESPFVGAVRYGDFTHEQAFTRRSLNQLLLSSGYSRVESFEDLPVSHGFKSRMRRLLWHAIHGLWRIYVAVETGDLVGKAIFSRNLVAVATK